MRTLSSRALASAFAPQSSEVWLLLLTIEHSTLSQPLRFVNNYESVTSQGNVYVAFPFEVELPNQDGDSAGEAKLRIDNIDRSIVNVIRSISSPPSITFQIVLASQPNVVEATFSGLVLRGVSYDALSVSGLLKFEDIMAEPVSIQMTPQRFPGMF
ncbi:Domain of unknown function DUF1833 [uncultured Caudovirales phage]|uniref:DUF1833 domain-containing protein n=1 Tax=uncultured Caudovirales phage TaxID=2100421 RepID=A0A6J5KPG3_9CAUD|nr:Domain of unknown function DUF1833 [uncultured Caudovirales phage]CAB4123771.1 Domain of unknown function DUF1833 [uncultured Caudovirales phage]